MLIFCLQKPYWHIKNAEKSYNQNIFLTMIEPDFSKFIWFCKGRLERGNDSYITEFFL